MTDKPGDLPQYARDSRELDQSLRPWKLPFRAWRRVVVRIALKFGDDNISILAAGCAFFSLLALVPALTSILLLYGLVVEPEEIAEQIRGLWSILPSETVTFLNETLTRLTLQSGEALGFSFLLSLSIALWSSTRTVRALMGSLNVVYDESEKRGIIGLNLQILAITIVGILGFILVQIVLTIIPAILSILGLEDAYQLAFKIFRWPFLALFATGTLVALYRLGPSRRNASLAWLLPGAVTATLAWLAASGLFSIYIENFGSYDAVYGSFGAAIILLLWMYWSFLIVLMGAEINSELEREVISDTTIGGPDPLGEREAIVADSVALRPDISADPES